MFYLKSALKTDKECFIQWVNCILFLIVYIVSVYNATVTNYTCVNTSRTRYLSGSIFSVTISEVEQNCCIRKCTCVKGVFQPVGVSGHLC